MDCGQRRKSPGKIQEWMGVDRVVLKLNDRMTYEIRKMRIGCSKLRNHMTKRELRTCTHCDLNVPESNEHFFEECTKFNAQRHLKTWK